MSNYLWIIDAGHGGIDENGRYLTAPAKMFTFPDGLTIYEGDINRKIAKKVINELPSEIDYASIYHPIYDTSLKDRVMLADTIYNKDKRAVLISIHSNAATLHNGSGFEIWTSPGQTKSDKIANIFAGPYQKNFPQYPFRADKADGDPDKEAKFTMLWKTDCPAVLFENLFFDNRKEAEFLLSENGQTAIANTIVEGILLCEKLKPI